MESKKLEERLEKLLREELVRLEEIKAGAEQVTYLPNHIYVEPTNICNLRCATCTPKEIKGKPGKLSLDMWKDIVNYLYEEGAAPTITLIGRGEPLIHPQIDEIVSAAKEKGLACYIITNGTLLSREKAQRLLEAGLARIQFSLHATTPGTYEKMTGKPLYAQVVQNIKEFIRLNDSMGNPCHVSVFSTVSSINEHEMDEFKEMWEKKVDRVHMHRMFKLHGDSKMAQECSAAVQDDKSKACTIPWWFFTIRWDGAIVPCALDHASRIVIENIYDRAGKVDLKRAWNSDVYRKLRKAEAAEDYCTLKEMGYDCQGCEARTNPKTFNELTRFVNGFSKHFTLQFVPTIKDLL